MKKRFARLTIFLLLLIVSLTAWNNVFKYKYSMGVYSIERFYDQKKNTVDVLFLGSSHAFLGFNDGTLWDEYGVASYVLAGPMQPMYDTYYWMKEALKTQKPKLIVLEAYCVVLDDDHIDMYRSIQNTFGMRTGVNKYNATRETFSKDDLDGVVPGWVNYHSRYRRLNREDFLNDSVFVEDGRGLQPDIVINPDWKGYINHCCSYYSGGAVKSATTEKIPLSEKTEEYYRKIIELSQAEGIPMIVVTAPYPAENEGDKGKFNTAADIAKEYDVSFVDYNALIDEIGIEYESDAFDEGHLNNRGSAKFTSYLGKELKEKYDLPDRRGDEKYNSWQRNADFIRAMNLDDDLRKTEGYENVTEKLKNDNYILFVSVDGKFNYSDEKFINMFNGLKIYSLFRNGMWCVNKDGAIWNSISGNGELWMSLGEHDVHLKTESDDDGSIWNSIIADKNQYKKVTNGVNILVYDSVTEQFVDCIGIGAEDYEVYRGL